MNFLPTLAVAEILASIMALMGGVLSILVSRAKMKVELYERELSKLEIGELNSILANLKLEKAIDKDFMERAVKYMKMEKNKTDAAYNIVNSIAYNNTIPEIELNILKLNRGVESELSDLQLKLSDAIQEMAAKRP